MHYLWNEFQFQAAIRSENGLLICLHSARHERNTSGRQDDVLRGNDLACGNHFDLVRSFRHRALTVDYVHCCTTSRRVLWE